MATTAKRYGLPYKGSKNAIAPWVVEHIPSATTLYDLFCGGCAITHAALLSGKWRKVVANDLDGDMPRFFLHCAGGGMRGENRWISREDFFRLKDTDPYVRICWSFGNNQKCYLYSKEIEPWKKALHYARVFGDTEQLKEMGINSDGSTVDVQQHHEEYKTRYMKWYLQREGKGDERLYKAMDEFAEIADKRRDELIDYIRDAIESAGMTAGGIANALNKPVVTKYMMKSEWAFPHKDVYERMQRILPKLTTPYDDLRKRVLFSDWYGCESKNVRCVEELREMERLQHIQRLLRIGEMQNITRKERLERLQSLESLESLVTSSQSYDAVPIPDPENSVLYLDPPYFSTEQKQYRKLGEEGFDSLKFYDWCERQKALTIISEYDMPRDRFTCVAEVTKTSLASGTGAIQCVERLFTPNHQAEEYRHRMGRLF